MSEPADLDPIPVPDTSHLITETEEPVDNILHEKNQRLLVSSIYASWRGAPASVRARDTSRPDGFIATSTVGLFDLPVNNPVVPDVMLSDRIEPGLATWAEDDHRSYFFWVFGKAPDLVVEIVSNKKGGELVKKRDRYEQMRIGYYVVFDPFGMLGDRLIRAFRMVGTKLEPALVPDGGLVDIADLGLKMGLWEGRFEQYEGRWLRFFHPDGSLLLTGEEKAAEERTKAEAERSKAEAERSKAEAEREKAEAEREKAEAERAKSAARVAALEAKLRALGVEPD